MKYKYLIPIIGILLLSFSPLKIFHPDLEETPETYAITELLTVMQAYDDKGPIQLKRIGRSHDGGYVVPEQALQAADAIVGYGISDDISFEDSSSFLYKKPSWGFDCTCPPITPRHKLCHFVPVCIASHPAKGCMSFEQQIEQFGWEGKKLFVKMDIEGNEYDALPAILKHADQITGIVLEIHFCKEEQVSQALELMRLLSSDFLLVHVHGNNYCLDHFVTSNAKGRPTRVLELSYIHKNLVSGYEISQNQSHPTALDMPNAPKVKDVKFTILR